MKTKSLPIVAICRRQNKNEYSPTIWQLLVIFVIVSFEQTKSSSVHAYANWLKCYIELDDEEEVIMHKHIIPFEQSHEKVYIEVQPYVSNSRSRMWMASTQQNYYDLFPSSKETESVTATTTTTTTITTSSLLKLRLKVPPSMKQKGVQFVVEVKANGVSFVGPGIMCDGDRAYSKQYDQHVLLQINSTMVSAAAAAANENENEEVEGSSEIDFLVGDVEIVAGWASGYKAVSLTPKMILRRSGSLKDTMNELTDSTASFKKDEGGEEL